MPSDLRRWLWEEAFDALEQAERLHRQFFHLGPRRTWQPPVDVFESGDQIRVVVALPGVEPDRIAVVVEEGALIVTGARPMPDRAQDAAVRRLEIPVGRFERRVVLALGPLRIARSEVKDGCLVLDLRKVGREARR